MLLKGLLTHCALTCIAYRAERAPASNRFGLVGKLKIAALLLMGVGLSAIAWTVVKAQQEAEGVGRLRPTSPSLKAVTSGADLSDDLDLDDGWDDED